MKKILCLVLVLLLVFSVGCANTASDSGDASGQNNQNNSPSENQAVVADREWLKGKTITIIVGSSAGGNSDLMVRGIIPYWEEVAGCTFVVDNRPGASGQVGYSYFLGVEDKGCEIITAVTQTFYSNTIVTNGAEYSIDDLSFINIEKMDCPTWTVLSSSPYQTLDDLITAIKENPGEIICGVNTGGASAIFTSLMIDKLGLDVKIVSYASGSEMRTALLGGHVDFIPGTTSGDQEIGDARPLVVCASERSEIWPDTPCLAELYPDIDISGLGSTRGYAVDSADKEKYPERFLALVETYKEAYESAGYQAYLAEINELSISFYYGPEESDAINKSCHALVEKYAAALNEIG